MFKFIAFSYIFFTFFLRFLFLFFFICVFWFGLGYRLATAIITARGVEAEGVRQCSDQCEYKTK